MATQKYKVIMELIDTKYFEKTFEIESDDFYEPDDVVPQNIYEDLPEILEEIFCNDFQDNSHGWGWNEPAIGNRDGFFIEQIELIQSNANNPII